MSDEVKRTSGTNTPIANLVRLMVKAKSPWTLIVDAVEAAELAALNATTASRSDLELINRRRQRDAQRAKARRERSTQSPRTRKKRSLFLLVD